MAFGLWAPIPFLISFGNHTVDIERPNDLFDPLGGTDKVFAVVSADVTCWVQPARSLEITQFGGRDIEITHNVYFASDPSVRLGDRIAHDGRKLLVLEIKDAGELNKLWRIGCEETQ